MEMGANSSLRYWKVPNDSYERAQREAWQGAYYVEVIFHDCPNALVPG